MAQTYRKIHLVTFSRFGLFSVSRSAHNVRTLKEKFGDDKFTHEIIDIERVFKRISGNRRLYYLRKYGFYLCSTCGLCKLAMHASSLMYCLEHNVRAVSDGANRHMDLFPEQMPSVVGIIKKMYADYGIEYLTPVFDYDYPDNLDWADRLGIRDFVSPGASQDNQEKLTAGRRLFDMGILPAKNVKGTSLDRKMQARCFQFILHNIYVQWHCIPRVGVEGYQRISAEFYREKIADLRPLIHTWQKNKK